MEEWRDIEGYDGLYQVSNEGRIKRLSGIVPRGVKGDLPIKERILKPLRGSDYHFYIKLSRNGEIRNSSIHQLVGKAFIPNPNGYTILHHKDHNPENNCVENLEWMSDGEHKSIHKNRKKRVDQISPIDGEVVNSYESAKVAADILECCATGIRSCCIGKRNSHNGYIWRYIIDGVCE